MRRFFWSRRRIDADARQEVAGHLSELTDRFIRTGLAPEDARAAARRQLGNVTLVREDIHHMNGSALADGLLQDVRYAFRQIQRSPGFAAVVIATLALGIGGSTAVFSVVHAVLVSPLPYDESGQLVRVYQENPGRPETRRGGVSSPHYLTLRDSPMLFTDAAASHRGELGLDVVRGGQAQRLRVLEITSDYFRALRAPLRGPGFEPDDEHGARRVILSDALWRTRFDGDLSVVGTTIQLSGEPYEVAGIAPAGFRDSIAGDVDAWRPYNLAGDTFEENFSLTVVGRLRAWLSLQQAQAHLDAVSLRLTERFPINASALVAVPLHEEVVRSSRGVLQLLAIAVGLVLLVACVNVANLELVRATGRAQEFAIRAALGSGRARLVRQSLVESLLLAGLGGLLGLGLASVLVDVLQQLGRDAVQRLDEVGIDPLVLGFAASVTVATALAFGLAPAVHLARLDLNRSLGQSSRSATGSRTHGRIRSGLAMAQLALALTLMAGASVLLASFHRLQQVDLGVRIDRILTFNLSLPTARYDAMRRAAVQEELARRIEAIPGVTTAGGTSRLPATGDFHSWPTVIESGPLVGTSVPQPIQPQHRTVSGHFFEVFRIPVLAGRVFEERDDTRAPGRAVVSASFARQFYPGMPFDQVVGQRFRFLGNQHREIIGVVGDVARDIYGTPAHAIYHAHRQFADNRNWALTGVVATEAVPEQFLAAVRSEVAAIDPELAVYQEASIAEVLGRGAGRQRFALTLVGAFAVVALMLAALGLYGVLAYSVRQRTQEIGIRMALGATAPQVRRLVLRQAAAVIGIGLVVGIGGALALGRWLSTLAFEVSPSDPRILVATACVLAVTGILAAWLPARRASRILPTVAVREG